MVKSRALTRVRKSRVYTLDRLSFTFGFPPAANVGIRQAMREKPGAVTCTAADGYQLAITTNEDATRAASN